MNVLSIKDDLECVDKIKLRYEDLIYIWIAPGQSADKGAFVITNFKYTNK
jgi:hypothetical protein